MPAAAVRVEGERICLVTESIIQPCFYLERTNARASAARSRDLALPIAISSGTKSPRVSCIAHAGKGYCRKLRTNNPNTAIVRMHARIPLLAQRGHRSEVKQTSRPLTAMFAYDPKQTSSF